MTKAEITKDPDNERYVIQTVRDDGTHRWIPEIFYDYAKERAVITHDDPVEFDFTEYGTEYRLRDYVRDANTEREQKARTMETSRIRRIRNYRLKQAQEK